MIESKEMAINNAKKKLRYLLGQELVVLDGVVCDDLLDLVTKEHCQIFSTHLKINFILTDGICNEIRISADDFETFESIKSKQIKADVELNLFAWFLISAVCAALAGWML